MTLQKGVMEKLMCKMKKKYDNLAQILRRNRQGCARHGDIGRRQDHGNKGKSDEKEELRYKEKQVMRELNNVLASERKKAMDAEKEQIKKTTKLKKKCKTRKKSGR